MSKTLKDYREEYKEENKIRINPSWNNNELISFIIDHLMENENLRNVDIGKIGEDRMKTIEKILILLKYVQSDKGMIIGGALLDNLDECGHIYLTDEAKIIKLTYGNYLNYLKTVNRDSSWRVMDSMGSFFGFVSATILGIVSLVLAFTSDNDKELDIIKKQNEELKLIIISKNKEETTVQSKLDSLIQKR